jgi:hypothetical protein
MWKFPMYRGGYFGFLMILGSLFGAKMTETHNHQRLRNFLTPATRARTLRQCENYKYKN